ncbi:MAG: hypothetical protein JXA60_02700 [Candidatus Coatesbacteria bacterium]|nr:hypothetical protein [Candidatus Coatesbacteria bacterium]
MNFLQIIVSIIFLAIYFCLIIIKNKHKTYFIIPGIALLAIVITSLDPYFSVKDIIPFMLREVNWNVIGIFAGTLILAEAFIFSKVPVLLSLKLIKISPNLGIAILLLSAISSFISMFVENVATVLILAPIAFELARRLEVSPVPFLISMAICSNLQGTATLIGDPPSMILGAYAKINFNDFFWYKGKPSIFFAIQIGAAFGFSVLYLFFHKYKKPIGELPSEPIRSWIPTILLVIMILGLAVSSLFDPNFSWLGGTICIVMAAIGMLWMFFKDKEEFLDVKTKYDWDTTIFLMGIFIAVGFLEHTQIIDVIANWLKNITGGNLFISYTLIVWISVLLSAFIDNVPYITVMLPVAGKLGLSIGGEHAYVLLLFGLLIGSCIGGNITPLGASANVVAMGLLKKNGHTASSWEFIKLGLPFTAASTAAGFIFLWLVWGH